MRNLIAAVLVLGLVTFSFFQFYHFLKERIVSSDLKAVTEKRIGAIIRVPVRIDRISVGLLKHISLSGLEIKRTQGKYPFVIGVKKMIVRYDLVSFLRRNFHIPAEIFLDAPRLTLHALRFSENLFQLDFLKSDRGILTRFEFEEGDIQLPWFRAGEELSLSKVEGRMVPKKGDLFDVRFKSHLAGVASGSLLAYGEVDPIKKSYHLELTLKDAQFARSNQIPITQVNGTLEFENETVRIRKLRFLLRGVSCELSGEIQNVFSEKPVFAIFLNVQENKLLIHSDIRADFKQETIFGNVGFLDREYRFSGALVGTPVDFQFSRFKINDLHQARGRFNLEKGIFQIQTDHQNERLALDFSIGDFVWKLNFQLDHFAVFGFDLVTYASLTLTPYEEAWRRGDHRFDVRLKTDYLIFQYQLLRDFRASARLSADGLDEILAQWGNVSELRGKITFAPAPQADLVLRAGPLSLNEFESFGAHPISLSGIFEGKLEIRGFLEQPDLNGAFTIEKGKTGSLEYDKAIVNFSGQLPYVLLKDSKVWKGKNTFLLKGGLNFALPNFLEGVQVNSVEQIVIWKGLELSSELIDSDFAARKRASGPSWAQSEARDSGHLDSVSRMEAEYRLGDRTSLQVTAEGNQAKKEYLTVGPKVKF